VGDEKRVLMEIEDTVGLGNVAAMGNKQKNEDPLPFLRTPSSRFGSGFHMLTPKKRAASTHGPMDKTFQQEKRDEVDLTIAFFSISTSSHLMLHGILCLLRCVEIYLSKLQQGMCL